MLTFDHEKLDVYQLALQFVGLVGEWIDQFPAKRGSIGDQLQRASSSVVLNIAEGAGEFSRPEKARFYRMAKRSATECAGALDCCKVQKLLREEVVIEGKAILLRVVSMLIRMIQSMEESRRNESRIESGLPVGHESGQGHGRGHGHGERKLPEPGT